MPKEPSPLERDFLRYWRGLHPEMPEPVAQHRGIPHRQFRFDFSWPDAMVAVELQGGTWAKGRRQGHTRGSMYEKDCHKRNLAVAAGWRLFYLTGTMLRGDPGRWLGLIAGAVKGE